ncbi:MAG: Hsp33 family molecular chaperone HslO [Hydrogenovibrio sp.]|uniref:Hsp33 family molecular chaperone HslO n=1 Tax=Hydrogenovibrio sp. TaxID=2065821 RepID=UPI0028702549|nr:Hsp33 family molecular chaperone HslO [Hydrogenovibrio sp.]MDR9499090.1 Hsp33 family molecular chaperone HslO [Hydrogenovibrio sp.]
MDQTRNFLFTDLNIRGQHLHVAQAWQAMIEDRHYTQPLQTLLGELTAVAIMLAKNMKHPGRLTIQVQGKGPVHLLMVEVTDQLQLRGVAKTRETLSDDQSGMDALLGDGQIMITLENSLTDKLFQSFVTRQGDTVAECFTHYLSQSDQLASKLWLAADAHNIAGLLIQKMPDTDEQDADGWERIAALSETVGPQELLTLPAETLLHRLFHEETVRLYDPSQVAYECPRDREKVKEMIRSLGETEARRIIEQEGEIVVHNEVCNFHERFDLGDIEAMFSGQGDQTLKH